MVEPHCLIEGIDSRDSFQAGFEAQETVSSEPEAPPQPGGSL
jgi:hypothetical protein